MKYVVDLDLSKNKLLNAVLDPLASPPGTPVTGQGYYDTAANGPRYWNGTAWGLNATNSLLLGGSSLAQVVDRANHTGSQLASTISDFNTAVRTSRLDQMAAPTAAVSLNSQRITGLAAPSAGTDATNRDYVDAAVQSAAAGIDAKPSVRAATTANITLSGTQTIDGVSVIAADRVLVKNQTTTSANGVYVVAAGAWSRAADANENNELTPGAFWYVEEGTVNGKTQWRIENTGNIIVGTTAITINQFGASAGYTAGDGISITGNSIAVNPAASGGILVAAGGVSVDPAVVAHKFSQNIGNGAATTITVTHNLNTKDVVVSVREVSSDAVVIADVVANTVNSVQVTFATAPASNAFRVTVLA